MTESWKVERLRGHNELKKESLKAGVQFASSTLRGLFILNGAAAVALLAFLGTLVTSNASDNVPTLAANLTNSLIWFALGAALSVVISFVAYTAQIYYMESFTISDNPNNTEKAKEEGDIFFRCHKKYRAVAVAFTFASLACFLYALVRAGDAFLIFVSG